MGVILSIHKQKALLRDGEWRCPDRALEEKLNRWTSAWLLSPQGPRLDSADPEVEVAREMAARTGGRLRYVSRSSPLRSARVYFRRRQFRLAFSDEP